MNKKDEKKKKKVGWPKDGRLLLLVHLVVYPIHLEGKKARRSFAALGF